MTSEATEKRRPTLKDIADQAGVSVPTVSKVVKGRADVSPETRARISAILREHDYVPRTAPATSSQRTIVVAFDALDNANNLALLRGVLEHAQHAGVHVVTKLTPSRSEGEWSQALVSADHLGVILVTSRLDKEQQEALSDAHIPLVVIDPVNTPADGIPSVGVNSFTGGYAATKHLIDLGHERIAFIGGRASECADARRAGYYHALREAGIEVPGTYDQPGNFLFEDGQVAGRKLLDMPEAPTAIFASNDLEALGVLDIAHLKGIRVPSELSVVGFDDSMQAISAAPHLTTVRQPFDEIGATAARLLLQSIGNEPLSSKRLELATELIVRDSTAPPASTA
ncbi:LacI family DNA-binding transcriptional regulator [Demequina flava]|uniref:LacI family DNA-binding transcriptional regulator n=1 Tax=Demequina flava TaxID=1095025 RepID=UPI000784211E|nr:LacI family DNA-binding transcriptional regulator [Demequina flava]